MGIANDQPRVALVTGGAKRVGRAIVERLAEAGFDVGFTYNSSRREADALVEELSHRQQRAAALKINLSKSDAVQELATWIRSRFGRIDVLVNCASMYVPDDQPAGASPELQRTLMEVNAIVPTLLMTSLAPELTAARGSVINFVDVMAEKPMPSFSAYCASKAALHNATLAYARKLAPQVRVNGIAPGVIAWPDDMPEADREAYLKRVPLARAGTPREAANLVHFLATDATYITGQIIRIDGGRSIT